MPKKFSPELRDRAVRMVYDRQAREGGPRAASIRAVAPQLGVGEETLRIWCNRYGPTEPAGPGELLEEENRRLKRELAEARRACSGRLIRQWATGTPASVGSPRSSDRDRETGVEALSPEFRRI